MVSLRCRLRDGCVSFIVPGDPQDVKVQAINSTAIHVQWKPPVEKERNGIIRGYHIHVQETKEEVIKNQVFKSLL